MSKRDPDWLREDVTLGSLTPASARRMLAWMKDPEVAQNVGLSRKPTLELTEDWIRAAAESEHMHPYAILVDGDHVGNVILDQVDRQIATARLSVYIGSAESRGGGVGRTAIYLVLEKAFSELALNKVWLKVHVRNARAIAVYAQVGFSVEGVLRDEFLLAGARTPVLYMGILAAEFASKASDVLANR